MAVNGDNFTSAYKRRPIFSEDDRLALVSAVRYVDEAIIAHSGDVKPIIDKFGVNCIVHGDDWAHDSYMRQIEVTEQYARDRSIEFVYTPYYSGVSTSKLIEAIKGL